MGSVSATENPDWLEQNVNATSGVPDDHFLRKVIQSFNTWAFKREQPCRPDLIARTVARAIERQEPIGFVLYWGKGPRAEVALPDLQCLDFLGSLGARVRAAYAPGAAFDLVLTDTHAKLNGHTAESILAYFSEVRREAGRRGFSCHLLGELTAAAGIDPEAAANCAVPAETLALLAQSAARWYRGAGTAMDGARMYYRLNMVEKRVIEKTFPSSIFVTFNGSSQRHLFPENLPIFYMYSTKRGTAVKPWFQADGKLPHKPAEPVRIAPA